MIIKSGTPDNFIDISKTDDGYHFNVKARFGKYSLENDYLVFEIPQRFIENLKLLERSRIGKAMLKGTEDFCMSFEPDGGSGAVWVQLYLEKNFVGYRRRAGGMPTLGKTILCAGFSIAGEQILNMVQDLENLFVGYEGYSGTIDLRKNRWPILNGIKIGFNYLKIYARNWFK